MNSQKYQELTYRQTCTYHDELRNVVYQTAELEYSVLGVSFSEITYKDVNEANSWY